MEKLDYEELVNELEEAKRELEEHDLEPEHQEETEGVWLISYADLMTLLMGFFALMVSMSTFEEDKFNAIAEQVAEFTGGEVESSYEELGKELEALIQEKKLSGSRFWAICRQRLESFACGSYLRKTFFRKRQSRWQRTRPNLFNRSVPKSVRYLGLRVAKLC